MRKWLKLTLYLTRLVVAAASGTLQQGWEWVIVKPCLKGKFVTEEVSIIFYVRNSQWQKLAAHTSTSINELSFNDRDRQLSARTKNKRFKGSGRNIRYCLWPLSAVAGLLCNFLGCHRLQLCGRVTSLTFCVFRVLSVPPKRSKNG